MKPSYVLDTSAIFAFIEDEPGSETVESLLNQAEAGEINVYLSFMTFMEVYYISLQEQGEVTADQRLRKLYELPAMRIESDAELSKLAGQIKAMHRMSIADAWIAALAKAKQAILVHKDPEFESIEREIEVLKLPYKNLST